MTEIMPFWHSRWIGREVFLALGIYGNMGVAGKVREIIDKYTVNVLYWVVEGEESVYTIQMDKVAYVMEKKAK